MTGRDAYGRFTQSDLKHSLPSYTNANLFRDCAAEAAVVDAEGAKRPASQASGRGSARSDSSARRALKLSVAAGSASLYEDVWTGLSAWISSQLERGRAVNVPKFFKIQFLSEDGVRPLSAMSQGSGRGTPRSAREVGQLGAPVFVLADDFIMSHKVLFRAAIPPGSSIASGVPIVDLQYSAVSQVCGVDKDTCQVLLKGLVRRLGEMMARGALVEIELPGNGVLSAANKSVSFVPTVLGRALSPRNRSTSPRNAALSPRAPSTPRSQAVRSNSPRYVGHVQQPREEIAVSVTPAPRIESVEPAAKPPSDGKPGIPNTLAPGVGNDSSGAANAMIYRSDAKPRRMRGEGIVAGMDSVGQDPKNVAYPAFLMPERGFHVDPRKQGKRVEGANGPAYSRYQQNLYGGIDATQKQLSEIDSRWRDAIKTDQLKLELMRAKAGEINTFLQKQILEKQARQEQERTRRINTPDVFARTGYPPVNSPSRDLKAMEVARTQKSTLNTALTAQMQSKDMLNKHAHESALRTELVNLKTVAQQLESERGQQKQNEQLTRATLKDSWERHSALKNIERRLNELEGKA